MSSLGEVVEEDMTKITSGDSDKENFFVVEYFRVLEKREDTTTVAWVPANPGTTSEHFPFS